MEDNIHQHCENCFQFNCNVTKMCKMVVCHLGCGARFHQCKSNDHVFVCSKQVVPCLSAVYGCPIKVQRAKITKHLVVCPASIVFCTMEWNRYPLYSKSRLSWVPFFQPNPVLVKGHLDVELALRDQRILQEMFKRRLRKGRAKVDILRLNNTITEVKDLPDQDKTPRHVNSVQVDMALALSSLEHKLKPLSFRLKAPEEDAIAVNCFPKAKSKGIDTKPTAFLDFESESKSDRSQHVVPRRENTGSPAKTPSNEGSKPAEHQPRLNQKEFESATPMNVNNSNEVVAKAVPGYEISKMREQLRLCLENNRKLENQDKQPSLQIKESTTTDLGESNQSEHDLPTAPKFEDIYLVEPLGLNVMLETLPKFQKQAPLYSIPCSQVFRREEYGAHFKNVHSEIHGGLNGWVEHRCPLAQYGCTFIRHRLLPNDQCGRITFNKDLGSFGVQHCMANEQENWSNHMQNCIHHFPTETCTDYLSNLPIEILEKIAGLLDGFSLCHFSRTSKLCRHVSQRVLESKGLVVLEWEKRIYDNGTWSWQVRQKKWFFSTSFTPVKKWVHSDKPGMASHLEKCPFFERYVAAEKFTYQAVGSDVEDCNYVYEDEDVDRRDIDIEDYWRELGEIAASNSSLSCMLRLSPVSLC